MANSGSKTDDLTSESVDALRERLNTMKRLMAEKSASNEDMYSKHMPNPGIIDGNFLSFALCGALVTILTVAAYAFYSLYHAVLKKFPSHHTEL